MFCSLLYHPSLGSSKKSFTRSLMASTEAVEARELATFWKWAVSVCLLAPGEMMIWNFFPPPPPPPYFFSFEVQLRPFFPMPLSSDFYKSVWKKSNIIWKCEFQVCYLIMLLTFIELISTAEVVGNDDTKSENFWINFDSCNCFKDIRQQHWQLQLLFKT